MTEASDLLDDETDALDEDAVGDTVVVACPSWWVGWGSVAVRSPVLEADADEDTTLDAGSHALISGEITAAVRGVSNSWFWLVGFVAGLT